MREFPKLAIVQLAVCFLFAYNSHAQVQVSGHVVDSAGRPIEGATVLILKLNDSSLVKGSVSKNNGSYLFEQILAGEYLINSSYSGYNDVFSMPVHVGNAAISVPPLKIIERQVQLAGITVTAKKPMFEQKIDRMVINVATSITNAGSTALDVLMRSPGVTVNQQTNTLSMNGKDGVFVMLNGKINRMPITALVQMLAGMSSANIEKIELITTPPSNFDAEGNAGFINIVLKKNTQYGTNGSFSTTAGYGFTGGPVFGGSITVNHRKEKLNLYGDYSFNRLVPNTYGTMYRRVVNGSNVVENYMNTVRDDLRRSHNARIGLDYDVSRKTTVGVLVSGFGNIYAMDAVNKSNIFLNNKPDTIVTIAQTERHPLDNYSINLNVQHRFTPNEQLSVNADNIYFRDANKLDYFNSFFNGNGGFLYNDKTKSRKETPIRFFVTTADYSKKIGDKADMEAGVKSTVSNFVNDVSVEREVQNTWTVDEDFTSKHNLDESIFAAYTSFIVKLSEKTTTKLGVRYEYTNSVLESESRQRIVDRHYGNWFPSFFLSHSINEKRSYNISYNRRITRPTFNDMAPFIYFVDPNTFFSGNPALQPSISNAIKIDQLFKRFIISGSYTHEKNTITNFSPSIDPANNKQTFAAENQKDKHIVAATVTLPVTVNKWWTMQNNMSGQWQQLNAFYKGAPLTIRQKNISVNTTQTFTLPRDFSVELSGFYQSAGLFGIFMMKSITSLNMAVQKKLGANGGSLVFNVTDFSGPPIYRVSVDAPDYNLVTRTDLRFSVTTVKMTYMKKFGNNKVKEKRSRSTGSEEERQRVQAN